MHNNIMLCRGYPVLKSTGWEVLTECICISSWTAITRANRPAIDFIATGNNTVVTGCSQDFRMLGWQWCGVFWQIIICRHIFFSLRFHQVLVTAINQPHHANCVDIISIQFQEDLWQTLISLTRDDNSMASYIVSR